VRSQIVSDEVNPYAPPRADNAPIPTAAFADLPSASMAARFMNLLIDSVVRFVLSYALGYAFARTGVIPGGGAPRFVFGLLTMLVYYTTLEYFFGFTIGKLITGTRVVDRLGKRPSFGQIVGRSLARWVPFDVLSFLGSNPAGGWHDRWSGTRVVRLR
jgi:uncharacterized RDD family membrane protein YckC